MHKIQSLLPSELVSLGIIIISFCESQPFDIGHRILRLIMATYETMVNKLMTPIRSRGSNITILVGLYGSKVDERTQKNLPIAYEITLT